ncbi:hypothetical protein [Mesorhizobium australicum]|uniref:hypothetical protein n=1 Tax=Mesorhizobium australicum TaxID=536018 RepID=UPI003339C6C4
MEHVSTVYAESRTLNRVEEVMTDFILCELAGTEPQFIVAIAGYLGINQPFSIKPVRRSVHEVRQGKPTSSSCLKMEGAAAAS